MTKPRMKVWEHAVSLVLFGTLGVQLRQPVQDKPTLPDVDENSALGLGLVQATDYQKNLEDLQDTLERNYADTLDTEMLRPLPDLLEKAAKMTMLLGHARTLSPQKSVYTLDGVELEQDLFITLIRLTRRLVGNVHRGNMMPNFDGAGVGIILHKPPRRYWSNDTLTYLMAYGTRLVAISVPETIGGQLRVRVYRLGTEAVILNAPRNEMEAAVHNLTQRYAPELYGDRALIERLHADGTLTGEVVTAFLQPAGGPVYTAPWHTSSRDGIAYMLPLQPLPDMPKPSRRLHAKRKHRDPFAEAEPRRDMPPKVTQVGMRASIRVRPQWMFPASAGTPGSAEAKAKTFEETQSAHLQRGIREFRQAHLGPAVKARQAQNIPGEHLGGRDDMRFKIPESTIDRTLAFKRIAHKAHQLFTAHPLALKPDYFEGADFFVCANRKGEVIRTLHFIFLYEGRTVGLTISYRRGRAISMQETHYGVYGNPRIKLPDGMQTFRGDRNLILGLVARNQLKGEWARYALKGGEANGKGDV